MGGHLLHHQRVEAAVVDIQLIRLGVAGRPHPHLVPALAHQPPVHRGFEVRRAAEADLPRQRLPRIRQQDRLELRGGLPQPLLLQRCDRVGERLDVIRDDHRGPLAGQRGAEDPARPHRWRTVTADDCWAHIKRQHGLPLVIPWRQALQQVDLPDAPLHEGGDLLGLGLGRTGDQDLLPLRVDAQPMQRPGAADRALGNPAEPNRHRPVGAHLIPFADPQLLLGRLLGQPQLPQDVAEEVREPADAQFGRDGVDAHAESPPAGAERPSHHHRIT